jgi:hypothetical protein
MKFSWNLLAAVVASLAIGPTVSAAVLYSQNFEPPGTSTSSASEGPGGYVDLYPATSTGNWQIQGGSDGGAGGVVTLTSGVDANGVGGSQALFANWDQSAAVNYTYNQYNNYGVVAAAGAAPASQVQVTLDLYMDGSETSNTPIEVLVFGTSYFPTLTNGAYTSVSYTLDQATGTYNGGSGSNFALQHGAGGFGFDANNLVRADNIVVQTIPEPAAGEMLAAAATALAAMRRRR